MVSSLSTSSSSHAFCQDTHIPSNQNHSHTLFTFDPIARSSCIPSSPSLLSNSNPPSASDKLALGDFLFNIPEELSCGEYLNAVGLTLAPGPVSNKSSVSSFRAFASDHTTSSSFQATPATTTVNSSENASTSDLEVNLHLDQKMSRNVSGKSISPLGESGITNLVTSSPTLIPSGISSRREQDKEKEKKQVRMVSSNSNFRNKNINKNDTQQMRSSSPVVYADRHLTTATTGVIAKREAAKENTNKDIPRTTLVTKQHREQEMHERAVFNDLSIPAEIRLSLGIGHAPGQGHGLAENSSNGLLSSPNQNSQLRSITPVTSTSVAENRIGNGSGKGDGNTPPRPSRERVLDAERTLYKPKSRLRLRLKLTPPHPPGPAPFEIPSEPIPISKMTTPTQTSIAQRQPRKISPPYITTQTRLRSSKENEEKNPISPEGRKITVTDSYESTVEILQDGAQNGSSEEEKVRKVSSHKYKRPSIPFSRIPSFSDTQMPAIDPLSQEEKASRAARRKTQYVVSRSPQVDAPITQIPGSPQPPALPPKDYPTPPKVTNSSRTVHESSNESQEKLSSVTPIPFPAITQTGSSGGDWAADISRFNLGLNVGLNDNHPGTHSSISSIMDLSLTVSDIASVQNSFGSDHESYEAITSDSQIKHDPSRYAVKTTTQTGYDSAAESEFLAPEETPKKKQNGVYHHHQTSSASGFSPTVKDNFSPSGAFAYADDCDQSYCPAASHEIDHSKSFNISREVLDDTPDATNSSAFVTTSASENETSNESNSFGHSKIVNESHITQEITPTKDSERNLIERSREFNKKPSKDDFIEDIFTITDQTLSDKFKFVEEIGFGNWGSVWLCKPRETAAHPFLRSKQPGATPLPAAIASQHHPSKVAIKLVHRSKSPTTAARVRALWSEMKVIRGLKYDPHPSIIGFDSFVITPSYALIVMPFLAQLMPVGIPEVRAKAYFRQLTSALAYLHEKGITHNDLKPTNIMLSHADVPVIVDFGFSQKWDFKAINLTGKNPINGLSSLAGGEASSEAFMSQISWGTPEYLDPPRAIGNKHDERLSDVWSLGVTFFEIIIGRTPFEITETEEFSTADQLKVYYDRTVEGKWLGDWKMSEAMESLLKGMVQPAHAKRLTASQATHHRALAVSPPTDIPTPPFVRTAASYPKEPVKDAKKRRARKAVVSELIEVAHSSHKGGKINGDEVESGGKIPTVNDATAMSSEVLSPADDYRSLEQYSSTAKETNWDYYSRQKVHSTMDETRSTVSDHQKSAKADPVLRQRVFNDHFELMARGSQTKKAAEPIYHKQPLVSIETHSKVRDAAVEEGDAIRRPASALALRSESFATPAEKQKVREFLLCKSAPRPEHASTMAPQQRQQVEHQATMKKHGRHVRIVSEGAIVINVPNSFSDDQKHSRQMDDLQQSAKMQEAGHVHTGTGIHPILSNTSEKIKNSDAERLVRFRTVSGNLLPDFPKALASVAVEEVVEKQECLDARLNRIAQWVNNVERIVEDAKHALEEAGYTPALATQLQQSRPISPLTAPSIGAQSTIHQRTQSAFSTMAEPATPPAAPARTSTTLENEIARARFKPTHLRRQRSDLTNFQSRTCAVEWEPSARKPTPGDHEAALRAAALGATYRPSAAEKRLRSHKSTGDLNNMSQIEQDPYDRILQERDSISRQGLGWTAGGKSKSRSLFGGDKRSKKDSGHHESKFKNLLHSVKNLLGGR